MRQPLLGLACSAIVMVIALGFISLFDAATFGSWVAFVALCFIPMQIVVGVIWGANPPFAASLTQPLKALVLIAVTAVVAAIVAPAIVFTIGEGVSPPGPIPTHYAIIAVVFTFWLAIMWGGWPFTALVKAPVPAGLLVLVAAYAVTYVAFRVLFDYEFLEGTPVYLASAPRAAYMAILPLVFLVTHVAAMFFVLCFDLWPLTTSPAVMKQPVLGIVFTLVTLALTSLAMYVGVSVMGTDPMVFLAGVTVPFIFGAIIMLNMMQNSMFGMFSQPLRGLANVAVAISFGVGLSSVYRYLAPSISGPMLSGPPGYELEIWLANALLGITFPLLVFKGVFFDFWPLKRGGTR
jgi:hypothetical protein